MLGKASNFARRARELGEAAQRPETFQLKSGMVTAEQARSLFMGSVAQGGYVAGIFGTGIGIATGRDDVGSFAMGSVGAGATLGALAGGVVGMRRGKAGKIVTDAQSYWRSTISGKPELMPKSSFMDALVKDSRSQAAAGKAHLDGLGIDEYSPSAVRNFVNDQWQNAPDSAISKYATSAFSTAKNTVKNAAEGTARRAKGVYNDINMIRGMMKPNSQIVEMPRPTTRAQDAMRDAMNYSGDRPNVSTLKRGVETPRWYKAEIRRSVRSPEDVYYQASKDKDMNFKMAQVTMEQMANKIGVVKYNSRGSVNSIELTHSLGQQAYSKRS